MVPAIAQVIPTADGVGTQVIQTGDLVEITGGQLSGDHANLFHSFEAFGLGADQIADFQVLPTVENVLGRVVGGAGSFVDGTLRVSGGDANLYLIDPAGIVFGENARLDVAGDFVATTATSIGFGDRWLEAIGSNDWASFVGNPSGFGFGGAGAIVNLGELAVEPGRSIGLLGDTVINTGSLSAAGGTVAIVANEAGDRLRLGIPGNVLSLEVDREAIHEDATALVLPELLAGAVESAGSIVRNPDGSVRLSSSPVNVTPQVGDALVSGSIDVSSAAGVGGSALVLGERVGLLAGAIDGSGRDGGGAVNIGGNFQGVGVLPNSELTMVDGGSSIVVDGVVLGDGGRAIVWADGATRFGGEVLARGGAEGGNGGFVEVSGRHVLDYLGRVDTSAPNGNIGTLLLDPDTLTIVDSLLGSGSLDSEYASPPAMQILAESPNAGGNTISWGSIVTASPFSNIVLEATGDIEISDIQGIVSGIPNIININANQGSLTIRSNEGSVRFQDVSDKISTNLADVTIQAPQGEIFLGSILTTNSTNERFTGAGASISLASDGDIYAFNLVAHSSPITIESRLGGVRVNQLQNVNFRLASGGAPVEVSAYGDISLNSIYSGSSVIGGGSGSASDITLSSSFGSVNLGSIDNEAVLGDGGSLSISAHGAIDFGSSSTIRMFGSGSGTEAGTFSMSTDIGDLDVPSIIISGDRGGGVQISSIEGDINTNLIALSIGSHDDSSRRSSGNIRISTQNGSISSSEDTEISTINNFDGSSGDISIIAGEDIRLADVITRILGDGESGNVSIRSLRGEVDLTGGSVNSVVSGVGTSGDVTILGRGNVNTSDIINLSNSTSASGDVRIFSFAGNVNTSAPSRTSSPGAIQASNLSGSGGTIYLSAARYLTLGSLTTSSLGNAGEVLIVAGQGVDTRSMGGSINLRGIRGDGGLIVIDAERGISVGNINTSARLDGGDIRLRSRGNIDTTGGVLNSFGGVSGGSIDIEASGNISTSDVAIIVSGALADSGSIDITSTGGSIDTTAGALTAPSAGGRGGNITLEANGRISTARINAVSIEDVGGSISLTAGSDIYYGNELETNGSDITFNAPVELIQDARIVIEDSGNLILSNTINGNFDLELDITNGRIEFGGNIGDTTPLDSLTITNGLTRVPNSGFSITTENDIQIGNLTSPGGLFLTSNSGNITANNLSTAANASGILSVFAPNGDLTLGHVTTEALNNAGRIALQAENVTVETVNSQSQTGIGGNILIQVPNGTARIIDRFTDQNGTNASISSAGAIGGGNVYIYHGGNGDIPFVVGDAARNGSAAAITRGTDSENTIADNPYLYTHEQDVLAGTTRLGIYSVEEPVIVPVTPGLRPVTPSVPDTSGSSSEPESAPNVEEVEEAIENEVEIGEPESETSRPSSVSSDPPYVIVEPVDPAAEVSTTPDGETSPVIPSEIELPETISDTTTTTEPIETDTTPDLIDNIQDDLDLNDPIVQLALLIGKTIGANTTIGTNPDTGNTEVTWNVTDENGDSTPVIITQSIPTLEPETTISEPVTIVNASTPNKPTPEITPEITEPAPIASAPATTPSRTITPTETETAEIPPDESISTAEPTTSDPTETSSETPESTAIDFNRPNLETTTLNPLDLGSPDTVVETIEAELEAEFEDDAGEDLNDDEDERLTAAQIKETLQGLEAETGRRGAIVYANTIENNGREYVILALVTPYEATIVRTVALNSDRKLEAIIRDFQSELTNDRKRRHDGYKRPAKELYDILVEPIEADLDGLDLDLLIYAVDAGLRHIPLAALHDGEQFLIERYSIGSIPSLGLTDTRYRHLRDDHVLAMGADTFDLTQNARLPAVPYELDAIVADEPTIGETIDNVGNWPGQTFLNQAFTFENLIQQRATQPYGIVHLATHASFMDSDAYIELWDGQQSLDDFREAEWYAPPTVELLVLSACNTAKGNLQAELGFAGLAVRSGAKSALASLWQISDVGTLAMMAGFYHALPDVPLKAEAVQAAQLAMLRNEIAREGDALIVNDQHVPLPTNYQNINPDFSHPYYWAAFSLVGSPW